LGWRHGSSGLVNTRPIVQTPILLKKDLKIKKGKGNNNKILKMG
jgi:hypothetical protein